MNLTIRDLGDGTLLLQFDGIPQALYSIEQTANLAPPSGRPSPPLTPTPSASSASSCPKIPPAQFYRSVYRY